MSGYIIQYVCMCMCMSMCMCMCMCVSKILFKHALNILFTYAADFHEGRHTDKNI